MDKTLKYVHFLGLVLLLGSILTYVVIAELAKAASLEELLFARQIIRAGTLSLTVPGAWMLALSGTLLTARRYGFFTQRWLNLKLVFMLLILLNAHLVIVPATGTLVGLAQASVAAGALHPEYASVYLLRESIPGAVNVLLILGAMALGVSRWGGAAGRRAAAKAGGGVA